MPDLSRESLRIWIRRLSLLAAVSVGLLSWLAGVAFLWVVLRMCFAFALIEGLASGSIFLFRKGAKAEETGTAPVKGSLVDFSVGENEELEKLASVPGQVENLAGGLPDDAKQAEIVKRMGWSGN